MAYVKSAIPAPIQAMKSDPDAGILDKAVADTLTLVNVEPKEVMPIFLDVLKDPNQPNLVLQAVAATMQGFGAAGKDALPQFQEIQKRETAKDEKQRDQKLLQTVNECIRIITGK